MRAGRTAVGCLVGVAALIGLMLLVRPLIFTVAPPRDDTGVTIGSTTQFAGDPRRLDVVLSRSHGLDGEQALDGGRVQVALIASQGLAGEVNVVNAASPVEAGCAVEIAGDRLADCAGRSWTFGGLPIDADVPPLQRFAARVETGVVTADLTRPLENGGE